MYVSFIVISRGEKRERGAQSHGLVPVSSASCKRFKTRVTARTAS
jgi:hypothetical protein